MEGGCDQQSRDPIQPGDCLFSGVEMISTLTLTPPADSKQGIRNSANSQRNQLKIGDVTNDVVTKGYIKDHVTLLSALSSSKDVAVAPRGANQIGISLCHLVDPIELNAVVTITSSIIM